MAEGTDMMTGFLAGRDNGTDGMMGSSWVWAFLIIALIFGWGGNGFGSNAATTSALTQTDLFNGFNTQDVNSMLRSIGNGICDGFYSMNTGLLNGFSTTQQAIASGVSSLGSAIVENRYADQQNTCAIQRNIDALTAQNYRNTCEITSAVHAEGEATRALMQANTVQELRDKLEAKDRDLLGAQFQLSQLQQNNYLTTALRGTCTCG